jgi:thiol-disulfide isomerase/thioredoxin
MNKALAALLMVLMASCSAPDTPQHGNTVTALNKSKYAGRWVVINYWAKWCKPCIKEIPELNALDQKYKQVAVLGVNYDGNEDDELQTQIIALEIEFPTLLEDPSSALGISLPSVLPTTLILNPDGNLVATLVGPQTLESLALATGQIGMPATESNSGDPLDRELQSHQP